MVQWNHVTLILANFRNKGHIMGGDGNSTFNDIIDLMQRKAPRIGGFEDGNHKQHNQFMIIATRI
jgi:hypothetical protein